MAFEGESFFTGVDEVDYEALPENASFAAQAMAGAFAGVVVRVG